MTASMTPLYVPRLMMRLLEGKCVAELWQSANQYKCLVIADENLDTSLVRDDIVARLTHCGSRNRQEGDDRQRCYLVALDEHAAETGELYTSGELEAQCFEEMLEHILTETSLPVRSEF